MCVLPPPGFIKAWLVYRVTGPAVLITQLYFIHPSCFYFFPPTRPTAAQEAGVHWPQNALNEIVQLQLCLPACDFMRVLPIFRADSF